MWVGDMVDVFDFEGDWLGWGVYFLNLKICVCMWIFKKDESIDNGFFLCCLEIVLVFCKCLFDLNKINVFCWIVFESDGFLGIIIDLYDNVVVF